MVLQTLFLYIKKVPSGKGESNIKLQYLIDLVNFLMYFNHYSNYVPFDLLEIRHNKKVICNLLFPFAFFDLFAAIFFYLILVQDNPFNFSITSPEEYINFHIIILKAKIKPLNTKICGHKKTHRNVSGLVKYV